MRNILLLFDNLAQQLQLVTKIQTICLKTNNYLTFKLVLVAGKLNHVHTSKNMIMLCHHGAHVQKLLEHRHTLTSGWTATDWLPKGPKTKLDRSSQNPQLPRQKPDWSSFGWCQTRESNAVASCGPDEPNRPGWQCAPWHWEGQVERTHCSLPRLSYCRERYQWSQSKPMQKRNLNTTVIKQRLISYSNHTHH